MRPRCVALSIITTSMIALLLAGCVGDPARDVDGQGAIAALAFRDAQRLPGAQVGAEPNIIAGPGGRVWVVAPGSVVDAPNLARGEVSLWFSSDRGASWEALRSPAARNEDSPWCSCDTDMDLGPDGVLYMTDFWVQNLLAPAPPLPLPLEAPLPTGQNGFVVEASGDDGRTWGEANPLTVSNLVANDRQYITAGREPGVVYLSYARGTAAPAEQPDAGLHLWRSEDGGRTFTQVSQPFRDAGGVDAFIAKPRIGSAGEVFFPWMEFRGDAWEGPATAVMATSRDGGATFTRTALAEVPDGVGGLWPLQADVGPDGTLHVAWMQRVPDGGSDLWYTHSDTGGRTFVPPRQVGWSNGTAVLPWIAHAGPGRAVIAFYGTRERVVPLEADEETRWDAWALLVRTDGRAGEPVRVSPDPVKVGVFCPQGASCPHDRELLDYPGVAWRDGWVHVAYAVSTLDQGAGPPGTPAADEPRGGHDTAAHVWYARAPL